MGKAFNLSPTINETYFVTDRIKNFNLFHISRFLASLLFININNNNIIIISNKNINIERLFINLFYNNVNAM